MSSFKGFPKRPQQEGFTSVPNMFFDEVLPNIDNMSELKILLAVFRKTYGWIKEIDPETGQAIYKLEDAISYSQFEEMTGLSNTSVMMGINRALKHGYLRKVQQGNNQGLPNAYKLVLDTDSLAEQEEEGPQYLDIGSTDNIEVGRVGTPLEAILNQEKAEKEYEVDMPDEKKEILGEIFGTAPKKQQKEKKKEPHPHKKFVSAWLSNYLAKYSTPYGKITQKEHKHIKDMLKEYGEDTVLKAVPFFFENYEKIDGLPNNYPNISIFYAWRRTIIPASIHGLVEKDNQTNKSSREFIEDKWEGVDDFFDN